jgi:hypothetical protein
MHGWVVHLRLVELESRRLAALATRVIFDRGAQSQKAKDRTYEPEPLEELTTLTQPDKRAFEATYENGIIHGVLNELEDHEVHKETLGYTTDDPNDFLSVS